MDTLQCMRIFARVAVEGGFAAAARKLNLATPVASRAVSHLESYLGTRLLNRSTRSIALTEAGSRYLLRCQAILANVEEAEAEAGAAMERPSGRLRVHALSSFGHHLVVPAVLRYQQQFPALRVELTLSGVLPNMLEEGYDASIVLAPELPDSGLVNVLLGRTSGVVCASPDYVREHGEPKGLADLATHPCLQLTTAVFPVNKWVFTGSGAPHVIDIGAARFAVNVVEALEPAVRAGLGIGILPVGVALPGLSCGALVRIMRDYEPLPVNVYALYPSRQFLDAKVRAWVDFLREDLPSRFEAVNLALARLDAS